ncbi:oxygenase MpaB family protein [Nocardioides yefusunii]|uniref:Oxygenase MpaB family protein n=1 Tax=Nocardioides yefusunii TaxID=2500546 RepID=A0ABW1QZ52_9ACTN|nr:oxygenase MpaB family protein [Nocardioides yefusunii]
MGRRTGSDRRTTRGRLPGDHWARYVRTLDPDTDHVEIQRKIAMHEFPWDMTQALSFALFRTYAVPGIGRLLHETGQFTGDTQKRYDDTTLLLEPPVRYGFSDPTARAAIRRINQMHHAHDIPDHEMRYVLSTFVVVPKRWLDVYGKRPLTAREVRASVNYYRELGRHMGIREIPENYAGFARLMDEYEAQHFAHDAGGRAVADATLDLLTTFYPRPLRGAVRLFSLALMDDPLLEAFGYSKPPRAVVAISRGALRARGRLLRHFPARKEPFSVEQSPNVKGYPQGYRVEELGTFGAASGLPGVPGCPVAHDVRPASPAA